MKRLIIFLIRKRLGLKKNQMFRFSNQKSDNNMYCFTDTCVMKYECHDGHYEKRLSSVSLNWLLSDFCMIEKSHTN
jgi:hypothetical protein